jgi:hypothetical protein
MRPNYSSGAKNSDSSYLKALHFTNARYKIVTVQEVREKVSKNPENFASVKRW